MKVNRVCQSGDQPQSDFLGGPKNGNILCLNGSYSSREHTKNNPFYFL